MGKDGLSNSAGDVVPNVGSPLQHPALPRGDPDILLKVCSISFTCISTLFPSSSCFLHHVLSYNFFHS